jgi:hypothetical protein
MSSSLDPQSASSVTFQELDEPVDEREASKMMAPSLPDLMAEAAPLSGFRSRMRRSNCILRTVIQFKISLSMFSMIALETFRMTTNQKLQPMLLRLLVRTSQNRPVMAMPGKL